MKIKFNDYFEAGNITFLHISFCIFLKAHIHTQTHKDFFFTVDLGLFPASLCNLLFSLYFFMLYNLYFDGPQLPHFILGQKFQTILVQDIGFS